MSMTIGLTVDFGDGERTFEISDPTRTLEMGGWIVAKFTHQDHGGNMNIEIWDKMNMKMYANAPNQVERNNKGVIDEK